VVVGIDGSDAALHALDWALGQATRSEATLHLVCCYAVPFYGEPGMFGAYAIESQVEAIKTEHEGFLEAAMARVRAAGTGVAVDGVVTLASAAIAITDEAGPGDAIVVGSTGRTGIVADTIGSVATAVCHRAHVPVIVVPAASPTKGSTMKKIVVGIDGSPPSEEALRWAYDEARRAGADVVVVHAWSYPYGGHTLRNGADPREQMKLDALRQLEASIDSLAGSRDDGPSVHARLVEDSAAKALIDEAADADLVVVGSRGRGGFTSLMLGSVSRAVVQHAPCPIAVIRHTA
jgi:nucleotide-binding universal stress UspA family protein